MGKYGFSNLLLFILVLLSKRGELTFGNFWLLNLPVSFIIDKIEFLTVPTVWHLCVRVCGIKSPYHSAWQTISYYDYCHLAIVVAVSCAEKGTETVRELQA